jgi:HPt (histidine-containing phosphotransfer) domain-containing protein
MNQDQLTAVGPVRSLNDDPDFDELVLLYVAEMPERIRDLQAMFAEGSVESLRVRAHQLKGSGAGYGFPGVTELAARLEIACKGGQPDLIADRLSHLIRYLQRVEC